MPRAAWFASVGTVLRPITKSYFIYEDVRYRELIEATQSLLATLDESQHAAVVIPFESPARTRAFCYVLARCNDEYVGLQTQDLNVTQKIALNNLRFSAIAI